MADQIDNNGITTWNGLDLTLCSGDHQPYEELEVNRAYKTLPPTLTDHFTALPSSSLGTLGILPMEILEEILTSLDFKSFTVFSQTSWQTHGIVVETREHRAFRTHFSSVFRAIHRSGVAQWHPVKTLYTAFRSSACVSCRGWAPLLDATDCKRYCYLCFQERRMVWSYDTSRFDEFPNITSWLENEGILRTQTRPGAKDFFCLNQDQLEALVTVIGGDGNVQDLARESEKDDVYGIPMLARWWSLRHHPNLIWNRLQEPITDPLASDARLFEALSEPHHQLILRCPHLNDAGRLEYGAFCGVCQRAYQAVPDCCPPPPRPAAPEKFHSRRCAAMYTAQLEGDTIVHIKHHCPGLVCVLDVKKRERERIQRAKIISATRAST